MFFSLSEDFLHYVWRSLNFDMRDLRTVCDQPIHILKPGMWNHDQGPDFLQASIRIGEIEWHGQVELHLHSRDWYRHKHQLDANYNNTILHVVLESEGAPVLRKDGTRIPELVLKERIKPNLQRQYERLRLSQDSIPCAFAISQLRDIHIYPWIERLSFERMEQKAERMQEQLAQSTHDWEQILWEELAAMMGGAVNQAALREMAQLIPYQIMKRYRNTPLQLEALLFGSCGLLVAEHPLTDYYQALRKEWQYLQSKHQLGTTFIHLRFLRMRPAAFPTIRLSQLASLVCHFFPLIQLLEVSGHQRLLKTQLKASAYWEAHYRFGEASKRKKPKTLGKTQKQSLIINTLLPLSLLYHRAHGRDDTHSLLESGLTQLAPEHNRLTRCFETLGIEHTHALHSQGLIQLKKHYCDQKKCMSCGIGHQVMKV